MFRVNLDLSFHRTPMLDTVRGREPKSRGRYFEINFEPSANASELEQVRLRRGTRERKFCGVEVRYHFERSSSSVTIVKKEKMRTLHGLLDLRFRYIDSDVGVDFMAGCGMW